ncbi:hypothetical protein BX616_010494 [Lobosporangium transversale]|nr:hypothetical protein BX616_010494 [Lobosporangium transversale]
MFCEADLCGHVEKDSDNSLSMMTTSLNLQLRQEELLAAAYEIASATESPAIVDRNTPNTRVRPNRPVYSHLTLPSQALEKVKPFSLQNKHSYCSSGLSSLWRVSCNQFYNFSNSISNNNNGATSISGKIAMIPMSTICGVGVSMFVALLFVICEIERSDNMCDLHNRI